MDNKKARPSTKLSHSLLMISTKQNIKYTLIKQSMQFINMDRNYTRACILLHEI